LQGESSRCTDRRRTDWSRQVAVGVQTRQPCRVYASE
jgi:hypothetical protein